MDKVCYLCFNCPSKEKKVADEQTYNRGTKVCNFYDVANTDEQKAIAEAIGVDKSTVYREIKRNCDARSGSYSMELAQRKADRRKQQKHRKEVLTPAMRKRIIKLLKKGFSPEQIVGRSRLRELRWYLTKRYIAGFGRISGGVANCTNIFADKVAGMPNVVLKMQGEDLSQAGWILMSVLR